MKDESPSIVNAFVFFEGRILFSVTNSPFEKDDLLFKFFGLGFFAQFKKNRVKVIESCKKFSILKKC